MFPSAILRTAAERSFVRVGKNTPGRVVRHVGEWGALVGVVLGWPAAFTVYARLANGANKH